MENGIVTVPHVSEITAIFSNAPTDHFIGQYSWDATGPVLWNTQVLFGGRYHLTYQVPVMADYTNCVILAIKGTPGFSIVEISKTDGTMSSSERGWELNEAQWEKLVAAKGDFSVLGIQLNTNEAVPNWDSYIKAARKRWKNPKQ